MIQTNMSHLVTGYNSKRNHIDESQFPVGMGVLVVDNDIVYLRELATMLHQCHYKVTPTTTATEALKQLTEKSESFDMIITDMNVNEMAGFKVLETCLRLGLPVIVMSAASTATNDLIMKVVLGGACDFLFKPIPLQEVKILWRHVFRKPLYSNSKPHQNDTVQETTNQRPVRMRWGPDLHRQFEEAVNSLGGVDKAVPKKILQRMGVADVNRGHVASHLQKYRKTLKKPNNSKPAQPPPSMASPCTPLLHKMPQLQQEGNRNGVVQGVDENLLVPNEHGVGYLRESDVGALGYMMCNNYYKSSFHMNGNTNTSSHFR